VSDNALTPDQIDEVQKLLEIEKIRKKKNLYSQLMDSHNFEGFADLYTEDAVGDWGKFGTWHGRDKILERIKYEYTGREPYDSLHYTTNLWIEMTGPDSASSRCYLFDVDNRPKPRLNPIAEFALYEEDWVRIDVDWKINRHRIFFLWPDRAVPEGFPSPKSATTIG